MRSLHKEWKNKQSGGFTRRVRWYAGGYGGSAIRLAFIDDTGTANRFYATSEAATVDWLAFKAEELTVPMIWAAQDAAFKERS